jgi:uncharacterized NAD(P)/FAD-binding protein YdhS
VDVGVVGAGASAVCLIAAMVQQDALGPLRLVIYEPSKNLWRGRAYQQDLETVRVNAPPPDMSAYPGDSENFTKWLDGNNDIFDINARYSDPLIDTVFVPRAIYGDYLEQSAHAALRTVIGRGWTVELRRERVDSVAAAGGQLVLHGSLGSRDRMDRAVLCFGAGEPADCYSLRGHPGFVPDPYPLADRLADIRPDGTLAVIGSGLTAIDV